MKNITYYFAFGSNIDAFQMTKRCPSAQYKSNLRLSGWKFAISPLRQGANIIQTNDINDHVWGCVYTITTEDETRLDGFECVEQGHYTKTYITHADFKDIEILVYTIPECTRHEKPYKDYHARILRGLEQRNMPSDYIENFRNMPKLDTNNPNRSYVGNNIGN